MIFSSEKSLYAIGAALTDVGHRRERNEDAICSCPEKGVFCVADGMGGAAGGREASQIIVSLIGERLAAQEENADGVVRTVLGAINTANERIFKRAREMHVAGMGSTVVALVLPPGRASGCVVHVGDSRAYLLRRGKLQRLTRDHTMAVELGLPEDEAVPPYIDGMLTRAVGLGNQLEIESSELKVKAGDILLLCSDGLTKHFADSEIGDYLRGFPKESVQAIANRFIIETKKRGAFDNVSVIVVAVQRSNGD